VVKIHSDPPLPQLTYLIRPAPDPSARWYKRGSFGMTQIRYTGGKIT